MLQPDQAAAADSQFKHSCDLDAQEDLTETQRMHKKRRCKTAEQPMQQQQQQQQQQHYTFECSVCGDKALGYNFDAITCESCKAFFRRNALKSKIQKCNFDSNCYVTVITRKFCPACRLVKCIKAGMKKEWILNAAQLQMRRQKTQENRRTRLLRRWQQQQQPQQQRQPPEPQQQQELLTVLQLLSDSDPEEPVDSEIAWSQYRRLSGPSLTLVEMIRSALNDEINNMKPDESDKILTEANDGFAALETPFIITLSFVRRFIGFIKRLPEFALISVRDVASLIKGGAFNFILMRGVAIYNSASDSFTFRLASTGGEHSVSMSSLAQSLADSSDGQQLMDDYRDFMLRYQEDCQRDQLALTLLQLVDFYNPARPGLDDMHGIDSIQQGYLVLLKLYIDSSWPKQRARSVFFKLLHRLTELDSLAQRFSNLCNTVGFHYHELNPLLIVLFQKQQCGCWDCKMRDMCQMKLEKKSEGGCDGEGRV